MKNVKDCLKFRNGGITLIALVITIILLLILAGVTIAALSGNNGILQNVARAKEKTEQAQKEEESEINQTTDIIEMYSEGINTATTIADAIVQNKRFALNTKIRDDLNNEVTIPQGFKVASDSATKVEDGIVIEDKNKNQFVWIPVGIIHTSIGDKTINYTRKAYCNNIATGEIDEGTNSEKIKYSNSNNNYYTEKMSIDEIESVNKNMGYYIGRFEAGDADSLEFRNSETDGTITIKKDSIPYNYITQEEAKTKAEEMSTVQEYQSSFTKLVSSYAWDTAISFIQIKNGNYESSSMQGNYSNTDYGEGLIKTGQTTAVSNIYDMGGNLWEYTTEKSSRNATPYVRRGGDYSSRYDENPAGVRGDGLGNAHNTNGFRVTLYLKY